MADLNKTNTAAQFVQRHYERMEEEKLEDRVYIHLDTENNCVIVNKALKLIVRTKDNIMVLEDPSIDTTLCSECKGKKEFFVTCLKCDGTGTLAGETAEDLPTECGRCDGKGQRLETCKLCKGTGQGIVLPDSAKTRPTSGRIVSKGPDCSIYNLGDRVAYSGYTGHLLPFKGNNRIRVMREIEPFCQLIDLNIEGEHESVDFVDKDSAYDLS
jgi:co-chaperonin GroES (HSP10)